MTKFLSRSGPSLHPVADRSSQYSGALLLHHRAVKSADGIAIFDFAVKYTIEVKVETSAYPTGSKLVTALFNGNECERSRASATLYSVRLRLWVGHPVVPKFLQRTTVDFFTIAIDGVVLVIVLSL